MTSRRSLTAWIILALIFVAVVAVFYAARVRAGAAALRAQQEQQLVNAMTHIAALGLGHAESAAANVGSQNWGLAQRDLGRAGDEIAVLEQIAPRKLSSRVRRARSLLGPAQEAVGARDQAALRRINELAQALSDLSGGTER